MMLKTKDPEPERPLIIPDVPDVSPIGAVARLQDVIEDDIQIYRVILSNLRKAWEVAIYPDEILRLALGTAKILQMRRQALLLPIEAERGNKAKDRFLESFDD